MFAGTPKLRSKQVVTAERCMHKTRLGYQTQARFTASQTSSMSPARTSFGRTVHFRNAPSSLGKLRPRRSTSNISKPIRAFPTRNRTASPVFLASRIQYLRLHFCDAGGYLLRPCKFDSGVSLQMRSCCSRDRRNSLRSNCATARETPKCRLISPAI